MSLICPMMSSSEREAPCVQARCALWVRLGVPGKPLFHAITGEEAPEWGCALAGNFLASMQAARESAMTTASVDVLRGDEERREAARQDARFTVLDAINRATTPSTRGLPSLRQLLGKS